MFQNYAWRKNCYRQDRFVSKMNAILLSRNTNFATEKQIV